MALGVGWDHTLIATCRSWRRKTHTTVIPVLLVSVYRRANAQNLLAIASKAICAGWEMALWALEDAAEELQPWTRGVGPGTRMDLLNRLLVDRGLHEWVVIVDDDVRVTRGSLPLFVDPLPTWDGMGTGRGVGGPPPGGSSARDRGLRHRPLPGAARSGLPAGAGIGQARTSAPEARRALHPGASGDPRRLATVAVRAALAALSLPNELAPWAEGSGS